MSPPVQFSFVPSYQAGESSRDKGLRLSTVRSHASLITHQRIRSKSHRSPRSNAENPASAEVGKAGATVQPTLPIRVTRLSSPPLSPEDQENPGTAQEQLPIEKWRSLNNNCEYPLSPPESPDPENYNDGGELAVVTCDTNKQEEPTYLIGNHYMQSDVLDHNHRIPFQAQTLSISDFLSGFRTDPFHCIPASVDSRVASTVDFYTQHLSPGNDAVCYIFDVLNIYAFFLDTLSVSHFYDAGMSVIQGLHDNIRNPSSPVSMQVLVHRGKAMTKLRQRILRDASNVDDSTLIAMVFMAILERSLRNIKAHELHKKSLGMIVSARGGLNSFKDGSLAKACMLQFDTLWSLDLGQTMFPGERRPHKPEVPKHPYSAELREILSTFPPGFESLAFESALTYDLFPVVYRASHLSRLKPSGIRDLLSNKRRWGCKYNDFAEACPALAISGLEGSLLEKLICTAILCFSYTGFGSKTSASAVRGSRGELTTKLHLYEPNSIAKLDCLMWMYVVAIDAWKIGSQLHPDGILLLVKLQEAFPIMRDVNTAIAKAKMFLWTNILEESVRSYWKDLISIG
ncbi:hypothetical protein LTR84_006081 [Exophiala bonariae]|uniref:Transcription factor domain-containing protein n=1 Tax=Exophiala bonariae TaxID=1690606 RepID=A0AAV9N3P2_9EURO|nr:hypothetical protein LTR84_006081 [Exophiala bonariae]